MDPKTIVRQLIESLEADKEMAQPYRNYALSDAKRLEAVIEKGMMTTKKKPSSTVVGPSSPTSLPSSAACSCKPGDKPDSHCPVHGLAFPDLEQ